MNLPKNALLEKISAGKTTYGIWNNLPHPLVAEILATSGYDWVLFDAEHGPFDLSSLIQQFQAVAPYEVTPVVRPPDGDPVFIKRLLDAGLQTFLVPMVESSEQAAELVKAMRYPPAGSRGIGAALGRASRWNRVEGYFQYAEREMCLIVQVETIVAFHDLASILEVDGVAGVFFGAFDLAASMGLMGQADHPEVVKLVKEGLEQTRQKGKIAGTFTISREKIQFYRDCGANFIGVGADTMILSNGVDDLIKQIRLEE